MDTRSKGISGGLAAAFAALTLVIGLASGLVLGGAGGFVIGQRLAGQIGSESPATTEGIARSVPGSGSVRSGDATPGTSPRADSGVPGGSGGSEAAPGGPEAAPLPGMPGITIISGDRPYLGVEVTSATTADGMLATGDDAGAIVAAVVPDAPAETAGLREGDRVVAVDGAPVADAPELVAAIADHKPDDEVTLTVVRDGDTLTIPVTLAQHPGVLPLDSSNPNLDELLDQMPEELRERFREMMKPQSDDTGA